MPLKQLVRTIRSSKFLIHNLISFIGSVGIGALNYLYYPAIGRLLEPHVFGEVQTLVSMFLQVTIFLNVLGMLTINIITNGPEGGEPDRVVLELEKLAFLVSLLLLTVTVMGAPLLQKFFHFGDSLPFVMLGLAVVATVPFTFHSAYLRATNMFGLASWAGIVGGGAKILFSAVLVLAGFGTTGAILGIALSQFLSFVYAAYHARRHGFHESLFRGVFSLPDLRLILPELKYALLVFVTSLSITALYSIDIVVVKHFFNARTAGLYAGVAAVARIIFFLTASIPQVLISTVRINHTPAQNGTILRKSLILLGGAGGAALLFMSVFPGFVMRILMGTDYVAYAYLLPKLSLVVFLIAVLNLFIAYFVTLRLYSIVLITTTGSVTSVLLLGANHDTLDGVINSLIYSSLITFVSLGLWRIPKIVYRPIRGLRLWRGR
jgi:O-antigen/teichoic acid export membrane protein